MTVQRPFNYYGSKERMCPLIHSLIPSGPSTWVDVFCGTAIVTLKKPRHRREVINDLHGDIVNLFEVLRGGRMEELFRRIELTPYAEELLYAAYDAPEPEDPVERAWRFLLMQWFKRSGDGHRTGLRWSKSQTVSPELLWARLPGRLAEVASRLRGVCIRKADALRLIDDYDDPDCILFVDPPYVGAVGRRYAVRMVDEDHQRLALRLLSARAKVIMTMNPGTLYDDVLSGWHRHGVEVQGGGNSFKDEVILTNFETMPLWAGTAS